MRRRAEADGSGTATGRVTISLSRRRALSWALLPAAQLLLPLAWANAARIASARLWPAQEYTRVILEAAAPIPHQLIALRDPPRIVLDLDGIALTPELEQVAARVQPTDPYIAGIRFGRKAPDTLRIVIDLKAETQPQLFALPPVAEFGHRVVLDLYPLTPIDPLMALAQSYRDPPAAAVAAPPPAIARTEAPRTEVAKAEIAKTEIAKTETAKTETAKTETAKTEIGKTEAPASAGRPPAKAELVPARRRIVVALDPGHGGEDPGAIGRRGTYEKNVVLAIARKLKALLDEEPGMRAMLTRDDDYYVPLAQRVQKARRVQADLFVSIHADAFRETSARGSSVFALSETGATSAAARWLAQKENAADLIGGVNLDGRDPALARTLLDLSQAAQINDSLKVGRQVLDGIGTMNPLHRNAVEQAGFAVLKAPDIPSILVETAFISNPDEELKLRSERHQQRFAESMRDGIRRYFAASPPLARNRVDAG
jgi:N-acetylmuramoyl-L-alanine amidase